MPPSAADLTVFERAIDACADALGTVTLPASTVKDMLRSVAASNHLEGELHGLQAALPYLTTKEARAFGEAALRALLAQAEAIMQEAEPLLPGPVLS